VSADFNGERLWIVRENTWAENGFSVWAPRQKASDLAQRLAQATATAAAPWIGFETLEVFRVEAGIPRLGADMDETTLPLEANLQHAISYSKGCYIGQEVIARATYRGHINRKLIGLVLGNELPPPRADLLRDGKRVGGLTTAVHSPSQGSVIALAYLHRDCWEPGTRVEVANYPAGATVHALPFSR
jgi:folate-binding protein YgfZ